jgi:hypothetical protein
LTSKKTKNEQVQNNTPRKGFLRQSLEGKRIQNLCTHPDNCAAALIGRGGGDERKGKRKKKKETVGRYSDYQVQ